MSLLLLLIWLPWQHLWICVILYENLKSDTAVLHRLLTLIDQPSILGPSSGMRYLAELSRTSMQRWCCPLPLSLSLRTAAVIEAVASTSRMWNHTSLWVLSLFVVWPFKPTTQSRGQLAETIQLKDNSTDQYLRSLVLPELPIHVIGVPHSSRWDKCQDMLGCLRPAYVLR